MRPAALAFCTLIAGCQLADARLKTPYQIFALKYGESDYPARLVNARQKTGSVQMHWLAYLIKSPEGGFTLIDCGFSDPVLIKKFGLRNFVPIVKILEYFNLQPQHVQTVILTHTHFDHALDIEKFNRATVFLHESEAAQPENPKLKAAFSIMAAENRLRLVQERKAAGEGLEAVHTAGHTRGSMVVRLTQGGHGLTIFTGDECYFASECLQGVTLPAAAAFDKAKNHKFVKSVASGTRLLTGHERHESGGRWLTPHIFQFD